MLGTLITLGVLLSGVLLNIIYPIHLPTPILDFLDMVYGALWRWNGYLPMADFFTALNFIVTVAVAKKVTNWAIGLFAMINGSGKPEV